MSLSITATILTSKGSLAHRSALTAAIALGSILLINIVLDLVLRRMKDYDDPQFPGDPPKPEVRTVLRQYDKVRIVRILAKKENVLHSSAVPSVGDTGVIVDVYTRPHEGYCVEHSSESDQERWLADFSPEELEKA